MFNWPEDQNQWTQENWAEFHELMNRHERLDHDLVNLTIQKHGGFTDGTGWIGLDIFSPGNSTIRLDGYYTLRDLEILADLLRLPSMDAYKDIREFDFKKYENIRDSLKREVLAMGLKPDLEQEPTRVPPGVKEWRPPKQFTE
jgi:hypothetical protein